MMLVWPFSPSSLSLSSFLLPFIAWLFFFFLPSLCLLLLPMPWGEGGMGEGRRKKMGGSPLLARSFHPSLRSAGTSHISCAKKKRK